MRKTQFSPLSWPLSSPFTCDREETKKLIAVSLEPKGSPSAAHLQPDRRINKQNSGMNTLGITSKAVICWSTQDHSFTRSYICTFVWSRRCLFKTPSSTGTTIWFVWWSSLAACKQGSSGMKADPKTHSRKWAQYAPVINRSTRVGVHCIPLTPSVHTLHTGTHKQSPHILQAHDIMISFLCHTMGWSTFCIFRFAAECQSSDLHNSTAPSSAI